MDIPVIKEYIRNSSKESSVYVGCDSHKGSRGNYTFVTVVVIHIDSCHGAKVFHEIETLGGFNSNRERLLKEVELAIDIALLIQDSVGDRPFSVHLDLNPNPDHFSSCVVKEAVGWVRGVGLDPVVKPDSFASSATADHIATRVA